MKIKLNSGYQRNELEIAAGRLAQRVNVTEDCLSIRETVAYVDAWLVDGLLRELEVSRDKALRGDHSEVTDEFFARHATTRGRCNAIASVRRHIEKAAGR